MADDVAQQPQEETMSGISDASPKPSVDASADVSTTGTTADSKERKQAPTNKNDGNNNPPGDQPPGTEASQFMPDTGARLKNLLGLKNHDPHLEEMLRTAQLRKTKDGMGLLIDMEQNGHSIHCGKTKEGTEFIGLPMKKMVVDEHDAKVMVSLARARGWAAINVEGNQKEKELLWVEAQRQGVSVANFQPDPNSDIVQKWLKEQAEQPKESITEAKPEDFHLKTMQLLQEKAGQVTDKDVKAGLEGVLAKFKEGALHGNEEIYKGLAAALSDKDERAGFNQSVGLLNKLEEKPAFATLDAPATGGAPAAAASTETPKQQAPAPKPNAPAPV